MKYSAVITPTNKIAVSHQHALGVANYDLEELWSPDTSIWKSKVLDLGSPKYSPNKAYWFDRSRYQNHGAITGATWKQLSSGVWCPRFDGASSVITIPDATSIQNIFDGGGTVEVVTYPYSGGEADSARMLDKTDSLSEGWNLTNDQVAAPFRLAFAQNFSTTIGAWQWATPKPIQQNQWNIITITYNSDSVANDPIAYVNGAQLTNITEASTPVGTRVTDVGNPLYIGNRSNNDRTFDGIIGEGSFYKGKMLTAQDALQNYNALKWRY